eukprot:10234774-Karenia_brevis.AAC.1
MPDGDDGVGDNDDEDEADEHPGGDRREASQSQPEIDMAVLFSPPAARANMRNHQVSAAQTTAPTIKTACNCWVGARSQGLRPGSDEYLHEMGALTGFGATGYALKRRTLICQSNAFHITRKLGVRRRLEMHGGKWVRRIEAQQSVMSEVFT